MKTYKVRRGLSTYVVEATSRSKAKYAAYKLYKANTRRPKDFFKWVLGVRRVLVLQSA